MSYAVATMKKLKVENLSGIQKHDEREFKNHSNEDIDSTKSDENFDLINDHKINFKQDIINHINKNKSSKRKIRKDAVVCNEWIISSDHEFFANLTKDQTKQYFETAVNYFAENFGKDNVRYATVHLDETTPHMHMGIVPLNKISDKDGNTKINLSSKKMFNRTALRKIQDELPKYMQNHDFNVSRGHENGQRKKLSVKEYKEMQKDVKQIKNQKRLLHQGIKLINAGLDKSSPDHEKAVDTLETRKTKEGSIVKLFKDFWQTLKSYYQKIEAKLDDRKKALDQQEKNLGVRELNLKFETESQNTHLADLAINLGVDPSWRENMIKHGGQHGKNAKGELVKRPFPKLIPELISKASHKQLKQTIAKTNQFNKNKGRNR